MLTSSIGEQPELQSAATADARRERQNRFLVMPIMRKFLKWPLEAGQYYPHGTAY